jgi:hypothetical protein
VWEGETKEISDGSGAGPDVAHPSYKHAYKYTYIFFQVEFWGTRGFPIRTNLSTNYDVTFIPFLKKNIL